MLPVVVHGGGAAISRAMDEAGIAPAFHSGPAVHGRGHAGDRRTGPGQGNLRVPGTPHRGAGGSCQPPELRNHQRAVRGADPAARTADGSAVDLGLVGRVTRVDEQTILEVCRQGQIPVIPSMCQELSTGEKLNVNADTAATAVARALNAEKLVYLSDVNGVRRDKDDPSSHDSLAHCQRGPRADSQRTDRRRHDSQGRSLPGDPGTGSEESSYHRRTTATLAAARDLYNARCRHRVGERLRARQEWHGSSGAGPDASGTGDYVLGSSGMRGGDREPARCGNCLSVVGRARWYPVGFS